MEPDSFDAMTQVLFSGRSRRATLRGVVSGALLTLITATAPHEVEAGHKRKKKKKKAKQKPVSPPPPGCVPATCAGQGQSCGAISDGCGGTLSCGGCPVCQTCSGGVCVADAGQNQTVCAGAATTTSICCNGTCCDGCCGAGDACGACLVF